MLECRQPLLINVEGGVRVLLLVQEADGTVEVLELLMILRDRHLSDLRRQVKLVSA